MATVTCHTGEGTDDQCPNAGTPIELNLEYVDEEGNTQTMGAACGVCGQPITDIQGS